MIGGYIFSPMRGLIQDMATISKDVICIYASMHLPLLRAPYPPSHHCNGGCQYCALAYHIGMWLTTFR